MSRWLRGFRRLAQSHATGAHDIDLRYEWAPRRNADIAAGVVMTPIHIVNGVEPDESQQTVQADTGEQVSNFRRLVRGRCGRCLGYKHRSMSEPAYSGDGWPEQGSEFPGRLVVVAVKPHPRSRTCCQATTVPDRRCCLTSMRDVDRPQPGDVACSQVAEYGHDVPPNGSEDRRVKCAGSPRSTSCRSSRGRSRG